jgi:hypothetical protein
MGVRDSFAGCEVKRRAASAALWGLALPCGWPAPLPAAQALQDTPHQPGGTPGAATVLLAHGRSGLWAAVEGVAVAQLLLAEDDAPFAAIAGGLWTVAGGHHLRRWRHAGRGVFDVIVERELGTTTQALAASADGRWLLAAQRESLLLLNGEGREVRRYEGADLQRLRRGDATRLFHNAGRRSFIASWPALGELWEIPLDPAAEPIFDGLVHDYRLGEGIAQPGYLGVRRVPLGAGAVPDLRFADARVPWLAGPLDEGRVAIVHLDVRRQIAALPAARARPQGALLKRTAPPAIDRPAWQWWLPARDEVLIVDTARWQIAARERLPGEVHSLGATADLVWALVAQAETRAVWTRRGTSWEPFPWPRGVPRALNTDATAAANADPRLLLATEGPDALHLLGADGKPQQHWPLPEGSAIDNLTGLPQAGPSTRLPATSRRGSPSSPQGGAGDDHA